MYFFLTQINCLRHSACESSIIRPLQIGLPDVKETHGIVADCVWSFRCLAEPGVCAGGGDCRQVGTDRFQCACDRGDEGCSVDSTAAGQVGRESVQGDRPTLVS